MRALVVYESMFGNTREIATAIAEGIAARMPVETVEVASAPMVIHDDVTLLVVGGPTHAHGMSKPESRADSAKRAGDRLVSKGDRHPRVARDDPQRLDAHLAARPSTPGSRAPASCGARRRRAPTSRCAGSAFTGVAAPESFLVDGPTGPVFDRLADGETERARAWGEGLAGRLAVPAAAR